MVQGLSEKFFKEDGSLGRGPIPTAMLISGQRMWLDQP